MTERTMWALAQQLRQGDFVPSGFEVSFSSLDNLKAMRIPLSEKEELLLRGRIDRVDLYEDDTKVYVKIIDYKSGGTKFDLAAVYYGLQLQLVVYMDAVLELEQRKYPDKEVVPAGIFYYNIKDPLVDKEDEQTPESILALVWAIIGRRWMKKRWVCRCSPWASPRWWMPLRWRRIFCRRPAFHSRRKHTCRVMDVP